MTGEFVVIHTGLPQHNKLIVKVKAIQKPHEAEAGNQCLDQTWKAISIKHQNNNKRTNKNMVFLMRKSRNHLIYYISHNNVRKSSNLSVVLVLCGLQSFVAWLVNAKVTLAHSTG